MPERISQDPKRLPVRTDPPAPDRRSCLLALAAVLTAGGCAAPHRSAPDFSVPLPSDGVIDAGLASWYGERFQGRRTASGDRFDMNQFTAAHRTLPFGSVVRVRNLDNGREVVVRINDRGPFRDGRVIDLSRAAAAAIDMVRAGTARVALYAD